MFKLRIIDDLGFEVWQDIPEWEGLYQASTYGRVRNKVTGKIIKEHVNCKWGYCQLHLWHNGKGAFKRVHRLIALTFLPNPNNYKEVNHKDENKLNNNIGNLEWCTVAYNRSYGTRNNRIGDGNSKPKPRNKKIKA